MQYTIRKLAEDGREVLAYPGRRVARGAGFITLEATFMLRERLDLGYTVFERGDRMIEHFFSERWYNVFECRAVGSDALRGWYCNIARPAEIDDVAAEVRQIDLALDVWIDAGFRAQVLDEDEFAALDLNAVEILAARSAVEELTALAARRAWPFGAAP